LTGNPDLLSTKAILQEEATKPIEAKEGEIWAFGGGKGGTGKTFITSCIGTCLAKRGRRVVLVDMDIGGANLHSFIGINRPQKSLTDFFESGASLSDLAVRTEVENMALISGDVYSLTADTIKFTQKMKLFRQLMKLNAQYVIIDLGAGSHLNTLDTFIIADKMNVVLVPEMIAIENMYHFVKNSLFRKVKKTLKEYGFREIAQHLWDGRQNYGIKSLRDLIDYLKESFPYLGTILDQELAGFKLTLILNMVRAEQDIILGTSIKSVLMKYLGVPVQFAGYLEYDDAVWKSVRERKPFMLNYLSSSCAKAIEVLVDNLAQGKEIEITGGF
jgi:flagellar biosynthesis protein FlhG